jgi:hypothetical protein
MQNDFDRKKKNVYLKDRKRELYRLLGWCIKNNKLLLIKNLYHEKIIT